MKSVTDMMVLVCFIISTLLFSSTALCAFSGSDYGLTDERVGGRQRSGIKGQWWQDSEIAEKLSLTEEQKSKLETAYNGRKILLIDLRAEQKKAMIVFGDALGSDFNESEAHEKLIKVLEAKRNLEKERLEYIVKVRKVLSLDQFKALKKYGRERFKKRRSRR